MARPRMRLNRASLEGENGRNKTRAGFGRITMLVRLTGMAMALKLLLERAQRRLPRKLVVEVSRSAGCRKAWSDASRSRISVSESK